MFFIFKTLFIAQLLFSHTSTYIKIIVSVKLNMAKNKWLRKKGSLLLYCVILSCIHTVLIFIYGYNVSVLYFHLYGNQFVTTVLNLFVIYHLV